jgi:uncharacterized protein (DUF362 family)
MPYRVIIRKCPNYTPLALSTAIESAVDALGGWQEYVSPGQRVLLKPNFIKAIPVDEQGITHPAILVELVKKLRALGTEPVVGDSPAIGSLKNVLALPKVKERFNDANIDCIKYQESRKLNLPISKTRGMRIARELDNFDVIINVPKLKAHCQLRFTGAAKNIYGFVKGRWKAYHHFRVRGNLERFALMLAELASTIPPRLTIVDAVWGMDRTGPGLGDPYHYGVIIAGTNVFAIDTVLASLFGIDWQQVPLLHAAHNAGIFDVVNSQIQVQGLTCEIQQSFKHARLPESLVGISFSLPRLVKGFIRHLKQQYSA